MNKRIIMMVVSVLLVAFGAVAQTRYTGKVVDATTQETIPGAVVLEEGTQNGATTDIDGNFSITVTRSGATLRISYLGFVTRTITLGSRTALGRIELSEDTETLGEVVVVGRGLTDIVLDRQTPIAATTLRGPQIEEKVGNLEFPEALKGVPSVYATSTGGYGNGSFRVRGFEQSNVLVLINGQPVNDMEWGGIYWSNWSGLTDVASVVQQQRGLGSSKLGISSVGGTTNIVTKASDRDRGGAIKVLAGNDGYVKTTVSYDSGVSENGWAVSALASYWRGDGYVEQTGGYGATYFVSIGYRPNEKHAFNFTATGAPQIHDQTYKNTLASFLKYGYKYNSQWGYLNGKPYSFSTNYYHKPIANFNWDWNISKDMTLSTVVYGSWGYGGGSTTLGNGFYRYPLDESGHVQVDAIVEANKGNGSDGFKALGAWDGTKGDSRSKLWNGKQVINGYNGTAVVSSMNNHSWYGLLSNLDAKVDNWTFNAGVDLRTYVGKHYRILNDLLGADAYYDNADVNSAGVFVSELIPMNPLAVTRMQDAQKISRNYDALVNWAGLFGQIEYANDHISAFVQGSVNNQQYRRHEFFEVKAADGWTDWTNKWGGNIKGGVNWKINRQHNVFVNAGYFSRQPYHSALFPYKYKSNANQMDDIENEGIVSIEGGYVFNSPFMDVSLNLYHTMWTNRYLSFGYELPNKDRRTTQGFVNQKHMGVELEVTGHATRNLDLYGMFSLGRWTYGGNMEGKVYDNLGAYLPDEAKTLYLNGVEIGGAPQLQARLGGRWSPFKGFSVNADWFYNDLLFAQIDATAFQNQDTKNLRLPAYGTIDAGMTYRIGFGEQSWAKSLMLRLNVNNVLNTRYIAVGYTNKPADADAANNWKGINKSNDVQFGYGRTWNIGATLRF